MVPLSWYLIFAAALFCIGLFGVLARKNAVAIFMGIELMLNAVNVNLIAFWRYRAPILIAGQAFAVIVFATAAAEVAVAAINRRDGMRRSGSREGTGGEGGHA